MYMQMFSALYEPPATSRAIIYNQPTMAFAKLLTFFEMYTVI